MNKTEEEYSKNLELLKYAGDIIAWHYEPVKLRLAQSTYYIPDFMVIFPGHIEFHEVKGFWRDDARVKFKVAAETYPYFKFLSVKKNGKGFIHESI